MKGRTNDHRLWLQIRTQAALILLIAASTFVRGCPANQHAVVRVHLHDYAHVDPFLLRHVEHFSARVFAKAAMEAK
jgi:hypothetical protein